MRRLISFHRAGLNCTTVLWWFLDQVKEKEEGTIGIQEKKANRRWG
jgi:hypothetical protein